MNTFLERLITEKEELASKLAKLNSFIFNEKLLEIDQRQAVLLKTQADVMQVYLNILETRISLLEPVTQE